MSDEKRTRWHAALWTVSPILGVLAFGLTAAVTQGPLGTFLWVVTAFFVTLQAIRLFRWQSPRGPKSRS